MAVVCFDTHVLIWGIKQEAQPSQREMIEKANALIRECQDKKDSVIIPAVVVAEMLCSVPHETHQRFFQILNESFMIVPFDARAALINARIWQEQKTLREEFREQQINRQAIKIDIQIAAIAIASGCNILYTEDAPLYRLAERYIDVKKISEIPLPPHQLNWLTE
ncbi:MAG: PIN domain-containing protein [Caldilineaceae bacterium]